MIPKIEFELSDNSGRDQMRGVFLDAWQDERDREIYFHVAIKLSGRFFGRTPKSSGELVDEYHFALPQMVWRYQSVTELVSDLEAWEEEPREVNRNLSGADDPLFEIWIGKSDELISSLQKSACVLRFSGASVKGLNIGFVTDQSCLRIFRETLGEAVIAFEETLEPSAPRGTPKAR